MVSAIKLVSAPVCFKLACYELIAKYPTADVRNSVLNCIIVATIAAATVSTEMLPQVFRLLQNKMSCTDGVHRCISCREHARMELMALVINGGLLLFIQVLTYAITLSPFAYAQ